MRGPSHPPARKLHGPLRRGPGTEMRPGRCRACARSAGAGPRTRKRTCGLASVARGGEPESSASQTRPPTRPLRLPCRGSQVPVPRWETSARGHLRLRPQDPVRIGVTAEPGAPRSSQVRGRNPFPVALPGRVASQARLQPGTCGDVAPAPDSRPGPARAWSPAPGCKAAERAAGAAVGAMAAVGSLFPTSPRQPIVPPLPSHRRARSSPGPEPPRQPQPRSLPCPWSSRAPGQGAVGIRGTGPGSGKFVLKWPGPSCHLHLARRHCGEIQRRCTAGRQRLCTLCRAGDRGELRPCQLAGLELPRHCCSHPGLSCEPRPPGALWGRGPPPITADSGMSAATAWRLPAPGLAYISERTKPRPCCSPRLRAMLTRWPPPISVPPVF